MLKKLSFPLFLLSLVLMSLNVSAQTNRTIYERVQQTYWNSHDVSLGQWLRIYPQDERYTEINGLHITGHSFDRMGNASIEIIANGRLVARMPFTRQTTKHPVIFPFGTKISDIFIRVWGEVYVESVTASVRELRYGPAPRPTPPRYEPAPRPVPPRQGPAPRPGQPRPGQGQPFPRR